MEEMKIQPHVQKILENRYYSKDLNEKSWEELCRRVAKHVASAEETIELQKEYEEKFYYILYNRFFSPNTPTWVNAGLGGKRSLSACFVLPLEDTMESILECSRLFGMVQKFGGGTGVALSKLRPSGTKISSTHGKAMGPLGVLKYLAATSQMVTQGGVRSGANMAVLDIYHPDVIDFIKVKAKENKHLLQAAYDYAQIKIDKGDWSKEEGQEHIEEVRQAGLFQLFNVSVAVDKKFMRAVEQYEEDKKDPKNLIDNNQSWQEILPCGLSIAEVWDIIVDQAWHSGDPGLLFLERAREFNKLHSPYEINSTNPCGEVYLPDYGVCNLGSIDVAKVDYNEDFFEELVYLSVRFLDNVITIGKHADPNITRVNQEERRVGLGIMGWADLLLKYKVAYDSSKALEIMDELGKRFASLAHEASYQLAKEKGAYPLYNDVENKEINKNKIDCDQDYVLFSQKTPRRNAHVTIQAPTGTISLVAGCSSGIEPHFMVGYDHQGMREHGGLGFIWASDTIKEIVETELGKEFSTEEAEKVLRKKYQWKSANNISVDWHIKHQAVWQKYIDNSISKTTNLANSATRQDVAQAYIQSYIQGCKGTTIYRDGCKPFQVLNSVKPKEETKSSTAPPSEPQMDGSISKDGGEVRITKRQERPRKVPGETYRTETSEGKMYITIGYDDRSMPYEVFIRMGTVGSVTTGYLDAIARLCSEMLRSGHHPHRIIKQLKGIKTEPFGFGSNKVLSAPDAIARVLEEYMVENFGEDWASEFGWAPPNINNNTNNQETYEINTSFREIKSCPECGNDLTQEEGCDKCYVCGYSKCG